LPVGIHLQIPDVRVSIRVRRPQRYPALGVDDQVPVGLHRQLETVRRAQRAAGGQPLGRGQPVRSRGRCFRPLVVIDKKIKIAKQELTELVASAGSRSLELHGIGPSGAARLIGDVGDIRRFASRAHFASWNGTAPIDASSGDNNRHRLSRAGNRRINRALHIMAIVQLRRDTEGRRYYRRRLAEGKPPLEVLRALKRRLSDVVYRQMLTDSKRLETGPGGHAGRL
jgi:transposase